MLTEAVIHDDRIDVMRDGTIQVREATVILRDGVRDDAFPPVYRRYVLVPGGDVADLHQRIKAVAASIWTQEVIDAHAAAKADAEGDSPASTAGVARPSIP